MLNNGNSKILINLPFKVNSLTDNTKKYILNEFLNKKNKLNIKNLNIEFKKTESNKIMLVKKSIYKNKKNGQTKIKYKTLNFDFYDFFNLQDFWNFENNNFENYLNNVIENSDKEVPKINDKLDIHKYSKDYTNYFSYSDVSKYLIFNTKHEFKHKEEVKNIALKKINFNEVLNNLNIKFDIEYFDNIDKCIFDAFKFKKIWTKISLIKYLNFNNINIKSIHYLKKSVSKFCYIFNNGPFKYSYILKGFDPRNNHENKIYQSFKIIEDAYNYKSIECINLNKKTLTLQLFEIKNENVKNLISKSNVLVINEKYGYFKRELLNLIIKTIKNLINTNSLKLIYYLN